MNDDPLSGCYEQTKWAKAAIDELQTNIAKFFATDPYEIAPDPNIVCDEEIWRFRMVKELPPEMRRDVGHILADLRDPLDNVLAILSDRTRGKSDKVGFPFCQSIEQYNTDLRKIEKLLPNGVGELIRAAQTYPGGNVHLRALHALNIRKKHRLPIAPFNVRTSVTMQALAVIKGGKILRVGFKNGQRLVPILPALPGGGNMASINNPTFIPNQGFVFEPSLGDDDMEVLAVVPGTRFYATFKPTLNVTFTDTPGLERQAVCDALHQMRHLVDAVLGSFGKAFF